MSILLDLKDNLIDFKNGVYVAVKLSEETSNNLMEYINKNIPEGAYTKDKLHSTLIFSKKPYKGVFEVSDEIHKGHFKEFQQFGPDNEYLVVELDAESMQDRNNYLVNKYDFISDFPVYKCHTTIAELVIDKSKLPPIDFEFDLCCEYVEEVNLDWNED